MNASARRIDWTEIKGRLAQGEAACRTACIDDPQRVQEILRQRTRQLASRGRAAGRDENPLRVLLISVGNERYGVDLAHVTDVLAYENCAPVPGAPPEVLGAINLRGEIRPVVRLSQLLELADGGDEERGFIVMLRCGALHVGFLVDGAERVAAVPLGESGGDETPSGAPGRYVRRVTADGTSLLDVPALFQHAVLRDETPGDDPWREAN